MARAVIVAAPASGSGKTVLTLGLLWALRNRGVRVASAKVGPDYIDPRFHEAATGRACFNLDPWAMDAAMIAGLLAELARDADLVVIEGVMGLFDGPEQGRGSTADLAEDLGLPVVLAVDCSRQAQSVAALVSGFAGHRTGVRIAGVILNRVAGDRHEAMLRQAIVATGTPVLGSVKREERLALPARHLGLVQAEENADIEGFAERAAAAVEGFAPAVAEVADPLQRSPLPQTDGQFGVPSLPAFGGMTRLAMAADTAFAFAYPHLVHGWRRQGIEIVPFSPLADEAPSPAADAVFLPGGYPELHAERLAGNRTFLDGLCDAAKRGAGIYGECGGFMVLGEYLADAEGRRHAMAGLLPLGTSFAKPRLTLGYRSLRGQGRWKGHEFHYSTIERQGAADPLFEGFDAAGRSLGPIGLRRGKVMGSYAHVIA